MSNKRKPTPVDISRQQSSSNNKDKRAKNLFTESDNEEDDLVDLDPKTKLAIESLAEEVSQKGPSAETDAKSKFKNTPHYWFLYDTASPAYRHFKKLIRLQKDSNQLQLADNKKVSLEASAAEIKPKKRRSRWGDFSADSNQSNSSSGPAFPGKAKPNDVIMLQAQKIPATSLATEIPVQDFDAEMFKAQILARQLAAKALAKASSKNQPSNEYDSDEDTEGGTFEHKLRMAEMAKTITQAKKATESAEGKHHLAHFLPPEEQQKFFNALKKSRAQTTVTNDDDDGSSSKQKEDYVEHKLQEDNVGFKLLQKLGWKSGQGLGPSGQGLQAPVNKGKAANDHTGLGLDSASSSNDNNKEDELFDVYRQRMMMAYKFRPNPLNNPRRSYY